MTTTTYNMHYLKETNIIISGWASSGTTTTALILAYILQKRFLYAGGTHKYIADKLGYNSAGSNFIEYEEKYGEKWDILWEKYAVWKLGNERNILANTKIAGFFTDHQEWLFEAFIVADIETRTKRAGGDKRTEDISLRDAELRKRWKKLFEIDLMDIDEIRENHDLIIENDNLSIAKTTFQIFKAMREALGLEERLSLVDFEKLEKIVTAKGKQFFYDKLEEKNLLVDTSEIFKDWIEHFDVELDDTAPEWKAVVVEGAKT